MLRLLTGVNRERTGGEKMLPAARFSGSRQRSGGWAGMTVAMDFGGELRALLEKRGLSLREAARLVPCDAGYLSRLAHGARHPSAAMAARLDQVLDAGGRLAGCAGREPDEAELDEMRRRELLGIFTMAGAALASGISIDPDRVSSVAGRAQVIDAEVLDDLAALNAHLWRVFALARSKMLVFPLVREQLDVLLGCLARPQDSAVYGRLCELAGDVFQLAGEVMFDANQYTEAAHCYALAAAASKEAGAVDLWACALVRHAFIGVYEHRFTAAAPMLDLAAGLARRGDSSLSTRYWVAAVQAETYAGLGEMERCGRALDAADRVRESSGQVHNGGWLRFDGSRLAEQRGTCYAALGRPDLAEAALTAALGGHLSPRRRAGVHIDLAAVGAQKRKADAVIEHGRSAVEIARQTSSGVVARRLAGLRSALTPLLRDPAVRDLDDEIASLATAAGVS